jgi:hypothetical protein
MTDTTTKKEAIAKYLIQISNIRLFKINMKSETNISENILSKINENDEKITELQTYFNNYYNETYVLTEIEDMKELIIYIKITSTDEEIEDIYENIF